MDVPSELSGPPPLLLEWLLERAPFGVAWCAEPGVVELNAEAARIAGLKARRVPVGAWLESVRLVDGRGYPIVEPERRPMFLALQGVAVSRTRMVVSRIDGQQVEVNVQAFPWSGSRGVPGAIVLVEDVSWTLESERAHSNWLGALGHELNGAIQLLLASGTAAQLALRQDPSRVVRYLEAAQRQSALMRRLVRDFVDAARLGAGAFECRDEPFALAAVLREMQETAELADSRHRILLEADESLWVRGDADRVKQILTNLLSNAAKYSNPGLLVLGAARQDDRVVLFLRDEGPGIPEGEQRHLFARFHRLPSRAEGSGLGLWIAQQLARHMGGELWLQSGEGGPTTFFVALPEQGAPRRLGGQPAGLAG